MSTQGEWAQGVGEALRARVPGANLEAATPQAQLAAPADV